MSRDYSEGYFFEEIHIYVVEAWGALRCENEVSAGDEQDYLITQRLELLEDMS